MRLVEDGLLGLNRPVRDYIPELIGRRRHGGECWSTTSSTHTAGYDDFACLSRPTRRTTPTSRSSSRTSSCARCSTAIYAMPLSTRTRQAEMNYSATGFLSGGRGRRTGQRSPAHGTRCRSTSSSPLGMKGSYLVVPDSVRDRIVRRSARTAVDTPRSAPSRDIDSRHQRGDAEFAGRRLLDGAGPRPLRPDAARRRQLRRCANPRPRSRGRDDAQSDSGDSGSTHWESRGESLPTGMGGSSARTRGGSTGMDRSSRVASSTIKGRGACSSGSIPKSRSSVYTSQSIRKSPPIWNHSGMQIFSRT